MAHSFTIHHEIERGEDVIELEIEFEATRDDGWHIEIEAVSPDIELTDAEEAAIMAEGYERADEALADAAADEADYRRDLAREMDY